MDAQRNGTGNAVPAEVSEQEAAASVRAVFDEIRQVLRVPFVDQLWRVLGHFPEFLPRAWERLAPVLGSIEAERAADELRREAVIPEALGLPAHKAFRGDLSRNEIGTDDRERISNYNSAVHYVLPKLLLAATLLDEALQPSGGESASVEFHPLPRGIAEGAPLVMPIDPAGARGQAAELFAEIRARHGYPALADYYRSVVMAGDFLRIAWNALRPVVGDPEYIDRSQAVAERARSLAAALRQPDAARLDTTATPDPTAIAATVKFYLERLLPDTLVELTVIKGLTDGPDGAAHNRYSLTDTAPEQRT